MGRFADRMTLLQTRPMHEILLLLLVLAAGIALAMAWRIRQRSHARRQAIRAVLDAADALEARLREARAEIQAIVGDEANPVREALQEMLRQRLWLQQHGGQASLEQLEGVRASIDAARGRIEQMLAQIERARSTTP